MCLKRKPVLDIWKIKDNTECSDLWPYLAAVEALQEVTFTPPNGTDPTTVKLTATIPEKGKTTKSILAEITVPNGWTITPTTVNLVEELTSDQKTQTTQTTGNRPVPLQIELTVGPATVTNAIEGEIYQTNGSRKWRPWWMCDNLWPPLYTGKAKNRCNSYSNKKDTEPLLARDFFLLVKEITIARVSYDCPFLGNRVPSIAEFDPTKKVNKRIFVSSSISVDHLIPTAISVPRNIINFGNNKLPCSLVANRMKDDWYPPSIGSWLSRKKYISACKHHLNAAFFQNSKQRASAAKIFGWL